MSDRTSESRKKQDADLDDELDFGDLDEMDFDMPDFDQSGTEPGSSRKPDQVNKKEIVKESLKGAGQGVLGAIGHQVERSMPAVPLVAGTVTDTVRDLASIKDELGEEIGKTVRTAERAAQKLLPKAKAFVPKKLYDKISGFIDRRVAEHYDGPAAVDKERMQDDMIASELRGLFESQQTAMQEMLASQKSDSMLTSALDSAMFKKSSIQNSHIYSSLRNTELFHRTIHTGYLKKSLELKFKHLYVAKDTYQLLSTLSTSLEDYMKSLVKNTSLPDMMKVQMGDYHRKNIMDAYGQTMAKFMGNMRSMAIQGLKNKGKELISGLSTGVDALAMGADMSEMMGEFGGGPSPKGMLANFIARSVARAGAAGPMRAVFDKLAPYTGALNQGVEGVRKTVVAKTASLRDRLVNSDNGLLNWIGELIPKLKAADKSSNVLLDKPNDPATFDVMTRQSIVEIIPGYLSRILQSIDSIRTGSDAERLIFNVSSRKFTSISELKDDFRTKLYGDATSRTEVITNVLGTLQSGMARNKGEADANTRYKGLEKDIARIISNHSVHAEPNLKFDEFRKYAMSNGAEPSYYMLKILGGVEKPVETVRAIIDAITKPDGSVDKLMITELNHRISQFSESDVYKNSMPKLFESYGYRDVFSDEYNARTRDELKRRADKGDVEARKALEAGMGLVGTDNTISLDNIARMQVEDIDFGSINQDNVNYYRNQQTKRYRTQDAGVKGVTKKWNGAKSWINKKFGTKFTIHDVLEQDLPKFVRDKFTMDSDDSLDELHEPTISQVTRQAPTTAEVINSIGKRTATQIQNFMNGATRPAVDPTTGQFVAQPPPTATPANFNEESNNYLKDIVEQIKFYGEMQIEQIDELKSSRHEDSKFYGEMQVEQMEELRLLLRDMHGWGPRGSGGGGGSGGPGDVGPDGFNMYGRPMSLVERRVAKAKELLKKTGKGISSGIKNVGKGYIHIYGSALKGIGNVGSKLASGLFGGTTKEETLFYDVYRKDRMDVPLLTKRQQENGVYDSDINILKRTADIKTRIYDPVLNKEVITEDDLKAGLVDIDGKPLGKKYTKVGHDGLVTKGFRNLKQFSKYIFKAPAYVDIYRKGETDGAPLLTVRQQKEDPGVVFVSTGKRVMRSKDINEPVMDPRTGNVLISEDDLKAGLVMPDGTSIASKGAKLVKAGIVGYFKWYGKIVGAAAHVAKRAADSLFGVKSQPYVDVYRKDEIAAPYKPILTEQKQSRDPGVYTKEMKRLERSSDIAGPIYDPVTGKELVTQDDVDHGLVDVYGKPIASSGRAGSEGLLKKLLNLAKPIAGGIGKAIPKLGSLYVDLYSKLFGLGVAGAKGLGKMVTSWFTWGNGQGFSPEDRKRDIEKWSLLRAIAVDVRYLANLKRPDADRLDDDPFTPAPDGSGDPEKPTKPSFKERIAGIAKSAKDLVSGNKKSSEFFSAAKDKFSSMFAASKFGKGASFVKSFMGMPFLNEDESSNTPLPEMSGLKLLTYGGKDDDSSEGRPLLLPPATTDTISNPPSNIAGLLPYTKSDAPAADDKVSDKSEGMIASLRSSVSRLGIPTLSSSKNFKSALAYLTMFNKTKGLIPGLPSIDEDQEKLLSFDAVGRDNPIRGYLPPPEYAENTTPDVPKPENVKSLVAPKPSGARATLNALTGKIPSTDTVSKTLMTLFPAFFNPMISELRAIVANQDDDQDERAQEKKEAEEEEKKRLAAGDRDGDGDVDGTYADQMAKKGLDKYRAMSAAEGHRDISWRQSEEESALEAADSQGGLLDMFGLGRNGKAGRWLRRLGNKGTKLLGRGLSAAGRGAKAVGGKLLNFAGKAGSKAVPYLGKAGQALLPYIGKAGVLAKGASSALGLTALGTKAGAAVSSLAGSLGASGGLTAGLGTAATALAPAAAVAAALYGGYRMVKGASKAETADSLGIDERDVRLDDRLANMLGFNSKFGAKTVKTVFNQVGLGSLFHALRGNDNVMTEQEQKKAYDMLARKVAKGVPGAERRLSEYEKAIADHNWERARALSGVEADGFFAHFTKNNWLAKGVISASNFLFGDKNKALTENEINRCIAKFDSYINKGRKAYERIKERFLDAVAAQDWEKARKIAKMPEDKGIIMSALTSKWNIFSKNFWVSEKNKPMTEQEINEANAYFDKLIAQGNRKAEEIKDKFNEAVTEMRWDRARFYCNKETKSGLRSIGSGIATAFKWVKRVVNPFSLLFESDQSKPMTEQEIKQAEDKIMKGANDSNRSRKEKKLERFQDAVARQKWERARQIADMPDRSVMGKVWESTKSGLKRAWGWLVGDDEEPMDESEINEARGRLQDEAKDGSRKAERKLEKFDEYVEQGKWKKAREIAKMPRENAIMRGARALNDSIKNFFVGDDKAEMDPDEIEKITGELEQAVTDGVPGAAEKLDKFQDAVDRGRWERARKIAGIKLTGGIVGGIRDAASGIWNWITGKNSYEDAKKKLEELEDKADEDESGILAQGVEKVATLIRRRKYDEAVECAEDFLKTPVTRLITKYDLDDGQYVQMRNNINDLKRVIERRMEKADDGSFFKNAQYKALRELRSRLDQPDVWNADALEDIRDEVEDISGDIQSEELEAPDNTIISKGLALKDEIEKTFSDMSWMRHPVKKWQLSSLKDDVESSVNTWSDDTLQKFQNRLAEIDPEAAERYSQAAANIDKNGVYDNTNLDDRIRNLRDAVQAAYDDRSWWTAPREKWKLRNIVNDIDSEYNELDEVKVADLTKRFADIDKDAAEALRKKQGLGVTDNNDPEYLKLRADCNAFADELQRFKVNENKEGNWFERFKRWASFARFTRDWLNLKDTASQEELDNYKKRFKEEFNSNYETEVAPLEKKDPNDPDEYVSWKDTDKLVDQVYNENGATVYTDTNSQSVAELANQAFARSSEYGEFDDTDESGNVFARGGYTRKFGIGGMLRNRIGRIGSRIFSRSKDLIGRFLNKSTTGRDADGNRIVAGEAGTEAILPIKALSGNLTSQVGEKVGDILAGGEVGPTAISSEEASIQAHDSRSEPLTNQLAASIASVAKPKLDASNFMLQKDKGVTSDAYNIAKQTAPASLIGNALKGSFGSIGNLLSSGIKENASASTDNPQMAALIAQNQQLIGLLTSVISASGIRVAGMEDLIVATSATQQVGGNTTIINTITDNQDTVDLRKRTI